MTVRDSLRAVGLDPDAVYDIVERALDEDLGPDRLDVTSVATIPADQVDAADLVARADGVVAGLPVAAAVFEAASAGTVISLRLEARYSKKFLATWGPCRRPKRP